MILIDALYLNSHGGKTIVNLVAERLIAKNIKCFFLIDFRLRSDLFKSLKNDSYSVIITSRRNRETFYRKHKSNFSSIICLANIPPPIRINIPVSIFFHNILLLPLSQPISFKNKLVNFAKHCYIRLYNQDDYNWIAQTHYVSELIKKSLSINSDQVYIYPIYNDRVILDEHKIQSNDFVYVSSSVSHKNHLRLINAFVNVAKKINKEIKLHLTIDKKEISSIIFPKNFKVIFHGTLSSNNVNELYNTCKFSIYPSLVESFGLPLIEAAQHGCKVIASDLPYVHEIIKPSLTFDPYSIESISNAILKTLNEDLPETKVLVENKIDNFIDFITSQDVQ